MGKYKGIILVLILLLGFIFPGAGWAVTPNDDVLVQKAKADLDKENYEEALQGLTEAWQKGTHTAEKAFLLGKAYRATLNFKKGRDYLEEALRLKPNFPEARLLLADTLVSLGQLTRAREELNQLEATGYEPGQTALLQGIVSEKEKQYSQALDYFRKAAEDPKVAQEAKFHLGQVLATQNQWAESKKVLTEAVRLAPETATAEVSQRYMSAMENLTATSRPYHITVSSSFDWDSNVTLQPGSPAAASQVSGKSDWAFAQSVTTEYTFFPSGPFSILGTYTYFQNFHPKITTYDIMSHAFGLSPTYEFKSGRLWVPIFYNYTDVQSDKYYTAISVTPIYLHMVSPNVGLEFGARFIRKYYWSQIFFPEDNRSSKSPGGSVGAYYFFKKQTGYIQARFTYEHDFTLGNNWDDSNYRFYVGALYPVTPRFKLTAFMDFILQPYTNKFFDPNLNIYTSPRNDQVAVFGVQGSYNVWKGLDANLHYFFVRDASNKALYDYNRHIIGAQLTYRY